MKRPLITLTTDFGLGDNYVGAVKGAIFSICPDAEIVDITHLVGPQDIAHGVYLTSTSWPYFPEGATHVAVVDPGVGTDRRAILLTNNQSTFIGPDNGVLSAALPQHARPRSAGPLALPEGYRAFELTEPHFYRATPSHTFHARDIFGPVAAHIASGTQVEELGRPISELFALPLTAASKEGNLIRGRIQHVDTFGNLVSDVPLQMFEGQQLAVEVGGRTVSGPGRTYGEQSDLFALVTSDGWLAVALPNGSAAEELEAARGDPLTVRLG